MVTLKLSTEPKERPLCQSSINPATQAVTGTAACAYPADGAKNYPATIRTDCAFAPATPSVTDTIQLLSALRLTRLCEPIAVPK
jgi:hypothetical protein